MSKDTKRIILIVIQVTGVVLFLCLLFALPTYYLWNWLMPEIFDVKEISFWQALGINFLSYILFKDNRSTTK